MLLENGVVGNITPSASRRFTYDKGRYHISIGDGMNHHGIVKFKGSLSGEGGEAECEGTVRVVAHAGGIDVARTQMRITRVSPPLPDGDYVAFTFGQREWVKCIDGVWT